jgi:Fur family ferric uptake transcriptional regulator
MLLSEDDLHRRGIRLTPQRRMILDAIAQCNCHVTVEELQQRIAPLYPGISLSTIYRTLERLLKLRLVAVTDLGGGRVCYEALERTRHHHLICHRCGATIDISDDLLADVRRRVIQSTGFKPEIDHLALWGVCPACQQKDTAHKQEEKESNHAHP